MWDEWLIEAEGKSKEAASHIGTLKNTVFSKQDEKGTIWDLPKDWDAKQAWNRINREDIQAIANGAFTANRAA